MGVVSIISFLNKIDGGGFSRLLQVSNRRTPDTVTKQLDNYMNDACFPLPTLKTLYSVFIREVLFEISIQLRTLLYHLRSY